ncbi:TIGR00730 family Rossman fold protein [Sphingomonas sp. LR61]|uniref:LOG family protein n=1 Tax=Sphingomonas sp. LR61 TaxID=3050234 RepID=UPI003FA7915B
MGLLADSALNTGGAVIGVMPRHLVDREIAHATLTRLEVVDDMHQRKARMMALADAFVALPGGAGTLEEIFEAWTWGQLGLHAKPCALYNIDGFYTPLLEQLDGMNTAGYLGEQHRSALGACSTPEALLGFLATYEHPASKWTDSAHPSAR